MSVEPGILTLRTHFMKRILNCIALLSLSAHAFVCEPPTHPVLTHSDVDMAADITALDTPESIAAKKAYEQAVISVVGSSRVTDNPNDEQELAILESVIAYTGPAELKAITSYVKSLKGDVIVKSFVMTRLAEGARSDCYELNEPEYQDIVKWVRKECKIPESTRALFPDTRAIDIKAGSREVCSSIGGGRAGCRQFNMSSCSWSTCR